MRFREAVEAFVEVKHSEGTPWVKGAQYLYALCSSIGDLELDRIRVDQVERFLNRSLTSAATSYHKYCVLRQFFCYWKVRREIYRLPLPTPLRSPAQTFVPYVYSRTELRRLLVAAGVTQRCPNSVIGVRTFRVLLLFLYGTGAMLNEAIQLERRDVDFRRRRITFRHCQSCRAREIPIGSDLYDILLVYHRAHHHNDGMSSPKFFLTKDGLQIKADTASKTFQRVRENARIARHDGARYQPRMHDLRNTFAVHRLTAWFKHNADMNKMIPALSTYMGQRDLGAAERYLRLTPERFRAQLNKLSPQQGKRRWRDDPALMNFLDSL